MALDFFEPFAHLSDLPSHDKCRQAHLLIRVSLAEREIWLLMLLGALDEPYMLQMHLWCFLQKEFTDMLLDLIHSVKLRSIKWLNSIPVEHWAYAPSQNCGNLRVVEVQRSKSLEEIHRFLLDWNTLDSTIQSWNGFLEADSFLCRLSSKCLFGVDICFVNLETCKRNVTSMVDSMEPHLINDMWSSFNNESDTAVILHGLTHHPFELIISGMAWSNLISLWAKYRAENRILVHFELFALFKGHEITLPIKHCL